ILAVLFFLLVGQCIVPTSKKKSTARMQFALTKSEPQRKRRRTIILLLSITARGNPEKITRSRRTGEKAEAPLN
ncbi:MAG: hypothetical protein D3910_26335, partial [Candidatus Electrothrix sp. ATG2]|nr:hypothetical protein [Candidatus Electrothrix sp. ATG2]